jgi:hypothetical protein
LFLKSAFEGPEIKSIFKEWERVLMTPLFLKLDKRITNEMAGEERNMIKCEPILLSEKKIHEWVVNPSVKLIETGEYRLPIKGEYYLTKEGSAFKAFCEVYEEPRKILKSYYGEPLPPPGNPCKEKYSWLNTPCVVSRERVKNAIEKIEDLHKANEEDITRSLIGSASNVFYRGMRESYRIALTILKGVLEQ